MNPSRKLKFLIPTGVVILGVAMCSPAALPAQATPPQTSDGIAAPHPNQQLEMAARAGHPPTPRRQLRHLTKMLNLNADQQKQMLPILRQGRKQMREIRGNASLTPQERRRQARALMMDTHQKLEAVMTDPQKQQFERMMQQRRRRQRDGRMQRDGNAPPPPAGQNAPPQE
jgi:hypothetical protein